MGDRLIEYSLPELTACWLVLGHDKSWIGTFLGLPLPTDVAYIIG